MTTPSRTPPLVAGALLALLATSADADVRSIRVAEVGPKTARLVVELDEPAAVAVNHGAAPFEWTALTESLTAATRHELVLTGLVPDSRVFYQFFLDGVPQSDVYQLRTGRSWASRRASLVVTAERPHGSPEEPDAARRLLRGEPDAVIVLGGASSDATRFDELYRRSLAERPVLTPGARDDEEPLRLVSISDVALALLSDRPLDAPSSMALAWASGAAGGVEGACWSVAATSRVLSEETAAMVGEAAHAAGFDVVLARGAAPSLLEPSGADGPIVLLLADADEMAEPVRHHARVSFEGGALDVALLRSDGSSLADATRSRTCPLPEIEMPSVGAGDELGLDGLDSFEPDASDCDY